MVIGRNGQVEEGLEDAVKVRRFKKIDSPDDVGDSLEAVVDDHREVITRSDVLSDEHGITEQLRARPLRSVMRVVPREVIPGLGKRLFQVEAQGMGHAGGEAAGSLVFGEPAAGSRIKGPLAAVGGVSGSFDLPLDVGARAEAG